MVKVDIWSKWTLKHASQSSVIIIFIIGYKKSAKSKNLESRILQAFNSLKRAEYTSTRVTATIYNLNHSTLTKRFNSDANQNPQAQARQFGRLLTNTEESTLIRWTKRYTLAGSPITPALLKELAQLLHINRVRHTSDSSPTIY